MTLPPDEQAREWLMEMLRNMVGKVLSDHTVLAEQKEIVEYVSALLAKARLAEAEWWHTRVAMAYMCDEQEMRTETRGRIDELKRQAAGEGAKP